MNKKINITDCELPIMKILWEKDNLTSPEIFDNMKGNINTLKTLLKRLVDKGAVKATEIKTRTYQYSYLVAEKEYIKNERQGLLQKVFNGSTEKMLLNFIKEENITKKDLQKLLDMIEEE